MDARHRKNPPTLWLMTDERTGDTALLAAVARLPRGRAGIIFRHYRTLAPARRALFERVRAIARARRLLLLLGGSARQAAAWRADGVHGPAPCRTARPLWHSCAVHDRAEARAAIAMSADLCFVSPLFPTRTHPGARALGRVRFAALAHGVPMPVMALGGVRASHRHMMKGIGADGWAAIDALTGAP